LQETWDENWVSPCSDRKITKESLCSLVVYIQSKGFHSGFNHALLRQYIMSGIVSTRQRSHTSTSRLQASRREYRTMQQQRILNASPRILPTDGLESSIRSPYGGRFLENTAIPSESASLLPYAHYPETTHRYRSRKAWEKRSKHRLLRLVSSLICCLLLAGVLVLLFCGIFAGIRSVAGPWRHTVWPAITSLWAKIIAWIQDLF
jgi:hypothetical protein